MAIKAFTPEYLESLTSEAKSSSRLRKNRNIHQEYSDPCQRLFNAIEPGSYIRPHRHGVVPRAETMFAIRGRFALVEFDEGGTIAGVVPFGVPGDRSRIPAGVEVPAGCWHTVLALEEGSILLEVKAGPFDPTHPKELAPWAPAEGSSEGSAYLDGMRVTVGNHLGQSA